MYRGSREAFMLKVTWCFFEDKTKSLKGIIITVSWDKKFNSRVRKSDTDSLSQTVYFVSLSKLHYDLGKNFNKSFFNYSSGIVIEEELKVNTNGNWTRIDLVA